MGFGKETSSRMYLVSDSFRLSLESSIYQTNMDSVAQDASNIIVGNDSSNQNVSRFQQLRWNHLLLVSPLGNYANKFMSH